MRQAASAAEPPPAEPRAAAAAPTISDDRPILGMALMVAGIIVFSVMDGLSKYLTNGYSPIEIAWIRYVFLLACLIPALIAEGPSRGLATPNPGLQILRGLGMLGSTLLFILALANLPIADATVIGLLSPFIVAAASLPMLGERVGVSRWLAILAGFAGVMVAVQPGSDAFRWAALFPLLASAAWALAFLITRQAREADSSQVMLGYTGLVGAAVTTLALPFVWVWPTPADWLVMLAASGCYALAQWLLVLALRFASAALVAPLSYTQIVWAGLIGALFFGTTPDLATVIGSLIIVASGIFIWHHERRAATPR
ncbi:MAG: DMT family transporter [Proteobacteria bacterium]|nr:DMT family transporter [Pseudomonadota bacterium]MBI3497618.1 DMT family transporter [Pseudomonadota bacterium]